MRQQYEQEHDRDNEAKVGAFVKRHFDVDHIKKLPNAYGFDYALVKGGEADGFGGMIVSFAEIKDRSGRNGNNGLSFGMPGGYYIAVQKVMKAQALFMATNAHANLIVRLIGDSVMWTPLDILGAPVQAIWHGHRDPRDGADVEPELAIPWACFQLIGRLA